MSSPLRPIVEADLHAFVDGQMDFDRRAAIVQAMAADPDLKAKIEQWRRQNEALAATFGGILQEPLPLRLMPTTLARQTDRAKPAANSLSSVRPDTAATAGPSAAMVAVAMAAFIAGGAMVFIADALTSGSHQLGDGRTVDTLFVSGARGLALRAYEAHRTFASDPPHPVDIPASDEAHLLTWIQHRLSMAIRLPDLRPNGWNLIGGRVLPGELGPAAFLMYGNGNERLGVYIARTNVHHAEDFAVYDNGAGLGSVGYWVDEPVGYAITTSHDSTWLDRNGLQLYQSVRAQARDNAASE